MPEAALSFEEQCVERLKGILKDFKPEDFGLNLQVDGPCQSAEKPVAFSQPALHARNFLLQTTPLQQTMKMYSG